MHSLQCDNHFSAFNIYPTTNNSLKVNDILWHTVQTGAYNPQIGDNLFGAHVYVLGFTPELFHFLSSVTLEEMHRAVIDFLVLLHHQLTTDADESGLLRLREDLVPEIWDQLLDNVGIFPNAEPSDPRRAKVLENIVQISFMTPWRVDVFAAFLTADDVTSLSTIMTSNRYSETPCRYILVNHNQNGTAREKGRVMLKLYQDWRIFSVLLHDCLGLSYRLVAEAMERAVHARKSGGLFEQAFTAFEETRNTMSYLSHLPADVIERRIIPCVIRRGCESIPPRRKKIASLKSLLELSSRYLRDIQGVGIFPPNANDHSVPVFSNVVDQNGYIDAGPSAQSADVADVTSERIGLGILADRLLNDDLMKYGCLPGQEEKGKELEEEGQQSNTLSSTSPPPPPPSPLRYSLWDSRVIYPLGEMRSDEAHAGRISARYGDRHGSFHRLR